MPDAPAWMPGAPAWMPGAPAWMPNAPAWMPGAPAWIGSAFISDFEFRISSLGFGRLASRLGLSRVQRPVEVAHRLLQPLIVLHQRDPHIAFAVLPERPPGRQRHLGGVHHPQAKIDRPFADFQVGLVNLRPDEHRRPRPFVAPAEFVQAGA